MSRLRRVAGLLAGLLAALALGAAGGIYADQAYPDYIPLLGVQRPAGTLDKATYDRALKILQADYYDPHFDYANLSHGSIKGLVLGLNDPFSYYLDPAEYKRQLNSYAGKYTGIGTELNFKGEYPVIVQVFPGSPALKAGLMAGDVVLAIDGHDAHNLTIDQASALIRGPEGSRVAMKVRRGEREVDLTITRAAIALPSVRSTRLDGGVLYIRIYTFDENTATDFDKQLKAALAGPTPGIVLDLRDDGGGFIDAAQKVISEFVSSGECFELHDHTGKVDRHDVIGDHPAASTPVVVLVNANTASASEMVSGSLRVHQRAKLVGTKTYGKGSVQQDFPLPDGSDLHITIRRWFLPDGSSVEKNGLDPTVPVTLAAPADMFDVSQAAATHEKDTQLNAALQLLASPGS